MKALIPLALAASMAVPAFAQTGSSHDFDFLSEEIGDPFHVSLSDFEGGAQSVPGLKTSIGPAAGYFKAKDADKGSWFGGAAVRLNFTEMFAGEASLVFRQDKFADGDITVTSYPVQVSGMVMPPLGALGGVQPYALAGFGWYYSTVTFSGALDGTPSDTTSDPGIHAGAGVQLNLGGSLIGYADFRYVWIDESSVGDVKENFDFWEVALGVNFRL